MYWTLLIFFLVEHVAMSIFTILTAHDVPVIGLCVPLRVSLLGIGIGYVVHRRTAPWLFNSCPHSVPPLLYDALLLVLTIRACVHAAPRTWRRTPLLALLYSDGVAAFLAVCGVLCLLEIATARADQCLSGMFILQGVFFLALRGPLASAAWSYVSYLA
jgi:hypothetical protein